jgi:D-3-phosphoglycerate dehydrogenase
MVKARIFISTTSYGKYDDAPLKALTDKGLDVKLNPHGRKMTVPECIEIYQDIEGLIAGTEPLTEEVMKSAKRLKVISRCGTGLDNVDLDSAKRLGIKVFNTPDAPTLPVAELTVGLILDLLRRVSRMDRDLKAGRWEKMMGNLLYGKKVGIIGFGRIGQKVAELLSAFGAELAYCDIKPGSFNIKCSGMEFQEILGWADIVTLHLSVAAEQCPVIGSEQIRLMKEGAWLVNVSRGGVVDEGALYHALKDGHLSGAALDVFDKEPYKGPLKELNNVILTPHIGSYAKEARVRMELEASDNLLRGLGESGLMT